MSPRAKHSLGLKTKVQYTDRKMKEKRISEELKTLAAGRQIKALLIDLKLPSRGPETDVRLQSTRQRGRAKLWSSSPSGHKALEF